MTSKTMEELWDEARLYGLVRLTTTSRGTYYCVIEFSTIAHVKLEATSSIDCSAPGEALTQAIQKAIAIVTSISEPLNRLKELSNGKPTST